MERDDTEFPSSVMKKTQIRATVKFSFCSQIHTNVSGWKHQMLMKPRGKGTATATLTSNLGVSSVIGYTCPPLQPISSPCKSIY